MTPEDRPRFASLLTALGELFDREITPTLGRIYFDALAAYEIDVVAAAVSRTMHTARFFPKPVELLEAIEGEQGDRGAWMFAQAVLRARYKPHEPLDAAAEHAIELLGGWKRIDHLTYRGVEPVEIAATRKEFIQLYRVAQTRQTFRALPGGRMALAGGDEGTGEAVAP